MPQNRKFTEIDLSYSAWHRMNSIKRFVSDKRAYELSMIDIDVCMWIEYNKYSKIPIALIETAQDIGQSFKGYQVTQNLAQMAGIPALLCLYKLSDKPNPVNKQDESWRDIESFRVMRLTPDFTGKWVILTPKQYAEMLIRMREAGEASAIHAVGF
jgi:hypothetical protein